ncbi:MAG: LysM domain-containing protein, partial [Caldilineae bacterium]
PTPTSRGPVTYTVRPGDTLYGIAVRFDVDVYALLMYNSIDNPTSLRPNQVLRIPPPDYVPPTPTPRPPTATPTPVPTPTPAIRLKAPVLRNPGNNASFQGADAIIMLTWENPDGIPAGIDNVVTIGVLVGPDQVDWRLSEAVGAATEFRVPAWLFGQAPQRYGRTYVWYVQAASVTRQNGRVVDSAPVSPPSEQRRFLWN